MRDHVSELNASCLGLPRAAYISTWSVWRMSLDEGPWRDHIAGSSGDADLTGTIDYHQYQSCN